MSDRRSGRARKAVDYSKFAGEDSDNDDDFRDSSTQPVKRKKMDSASPPKPVKVKLTKLDVGSKNEIKKSDKQKNDEDNVQKKRPSLSDKVLQRHLSEALEISKQNSTLPVNEKEHGSSLLLSEQEEGEEEEEEEKNYQDNEKKADLSVSFGDNIVEELKGKKSKAEDTEWNGASSSGNSEEEDASDWSDEDKEMKVKKPAMKNKGSSGNQDEEDGSDWSDDDREKKNRKLTAEKREPKKQTKKAGSSKVQQSSTPASVKCIRPSRKLPGSSIASPGLKPSIKTGGTPCQIISSPVKLPPKGLRLGLSRKVSGKPLHSVMKVQQ